MKPASSIDDILDDLDRIVDRARADGSRAGYFAALYRRVTRRIRDEIQEDRFDDGPRMERLDVVFAQRYLEAHRLWRAGQATTDAWSVAFRAVDDWWPIVLQHLLLGINAHINLDLGIAAARCAPGSDLDSLERDFFRITGILGSMVDDVQARLVDVWPLLGVLDRLGGRGDEATIHFSLSKARRQAWRFARTLASTSEDGWPEMIRPVDSRVAALGRKVRHPGPLLGGAVIAVRLGELRSVPRVIDLLS